MPHDHRLEQRAIVVRVCFITALGQEIFKNRIHCLIMTCKYHICHFIFAKTRLSRLGEATAETRIHAQLIKYCYIINIFVGCLYYRRMKLGFTGLKISESNDTICLWRHICKTYV